MTRVSPYCVLPDGRIQTDQAAPLAIISGSFNPLHHGHRILADTARNRLQCAVHFELSMTNVDKPALDSCEVDQRLEQFRNYAPIWVTAAPTFVEKAVLFPGVVFVMGYDTAIRLIDARYYHHQHAQRDKALRQIQAMGCRFLIGGRIDSAGQYRVWETSLVDDEFRNLFDVIGEQEFRVDVSSTVIRNQSL